MNENRYGFPSSDNTGGGKKGKKRDPPNASVDERIPVFLVQQMPSVEGEVLGNPVRVRRNTGSNTAIIRRNLVPKQRLTGESSRVLLIDGSAREVPEAKISVNSPYFKGEMTALCIDKPLYKLVHGNLPGVRDPHKPDLKWKPPRVDKSDNVTRDCSMEAEECPQYVSATVKPHEDKITPLSVPKIKWRDVTKDQLTEEQQNDKTLKAVFAKVGNDFKSPKGHSYKFLEIGGLLYREYYFVTGRKFSQLVVPKIFRKHILEVGNESFMAGHQGIRRTTDRILADSDWPDLHGDMKRFVKSSDKCQRTTPKGKIGVAPLENMPVIRTPFERVAVKLIDPFSPYSDHGNHYILTLINFATRYADAIALPAIDAAHVAERLIEIFSRVGLPKEIVTDQGRSFTAELMVEVGHVLAIKFFQTTPYHAMANGLIEKFNGTLKMMLKRISQEKPRSRDRYLAPLLFAHRKVPQASLGFSPFQLIYGRHVRGPLRVLKELWSNEVINDCAASQAIDSEALRETFRAIVRDELRKLLSSTQPPVNSIGDIVREEVRQLLRIL
nr:uncharacterized protein LOC119162962 [Rhipicephalus microplus]